MRSLVITFVLLVVAGASLVVYLAAPPEGAGGEPHVNVKVAPPKDQLSGAAEGASASGKAQGSLSSIVAPKPAATLPETSLPTSVTAMPSLGGAAATGSNVEPGLESGGVTVTEQLMGQSGSDGQN